MGPGHGGGGETGGVQAEQLKMPDGASGERRDEREQGKENAGPLYSDRVGGTQYTSRMIRG